MKIVPDMSVSGAGGFVIMRNAAGACRSARGFSLLEALIALVVFSIALLGLAAMYVNMMGMSHSSYLRTLATLQASDFEERLRANPAQDATAIDNYAVTCPHTGSLTRADDDKTNWCSNTSDLFGGLLVAAKAERKVVGDFNDYVITIQWNERGLGTNSAGEQGKQVLETQTFEYRVRR